MVMLAVVPGLRLAGARIRRPAAFLPPWPVISVYRMVTTWKERTSFRTAIEKGTLKAAIAATAMGTVAALASSGAAPAIASARNAPAPDGYRGRLVSVTPLRTLPGKAAVKAELTADGFATTSVRYGVRTYRLVYRTVSATGQPTTASGLLAVPISGEHRLTVVSFTHGTEVYRGAAPSMQPHGFEPAPAYTYASAGFATADPDYLGLGTGPGTHPWMDVPSETTAAADMLRAARGYLASRGRTLRDRVLVTGFSQGASAALGLGRALQQGAVPGFRLGALAPISGVYDFRGVELPAILDGELVKLNPDRKLGAKYSVLYAAYTLVAFNRLHRFYTSPAEVFRRPYAATIQRLLDSNHTGRQVFDGTPATLGKLLTARGFALLRHPAGGLATELRVDDRVCDWVPAAPARLYLATDDEQAVTANAWHCRADFAARHRQVPVINLGTPDYGHSRHLGSNVAGTAQIVRWFTHLTH
jgi:hypothetical protein